MSRRLPGTLLLILLALGFISARPAWAEGNGEQIGNVLVRVSPLTLLMEHEVTIKVGEFTCHLVNGVDPSSQCSNLPPGEYEVRAVSEGYFTVPPSYPLIIPGETDEENTEDEDRDEEDTDEKNNEEEDDAEVSSATLNADGEFLFKFYQIRNEMFIPSMHVEP